MTGTFDLYPLRFQFAATRLRQWSPNALRGAVGAALKRLDPGAYERYFAPRNTHGGGPSGFADPPRPFVLRPGGALQLGVNVFDEKAVPLFARVMAELGEIQSSSGAERVVVPLAPVERTICRVRVHFVTPTELKGVERPDFGALLSRIRDRVSTLRALYGPGPLAMDFRAFGERASQVYMTRRDLDYVESSRVSKNTGQRHPLSGFTGIAEYEGELAEFVPFLETAHWTGVGRQTVWGKGELSVEEI